MALPIYPDKTVLKGLGFSSKWTPEFLNMPTAQAVSGAEIDLALAAYPIHNFELTYNFLRDSKDGRHGWPAIGGLEFRTLMGFWLQLGGTAGRFAFKNPDDNRVFQQNVGTGDGVTTVFTLTRTFGTGVYGASEPVGAVDTTRPFNVYLGGSNVALSVGAYTLSTTNPFAQTLTLGAPPTLGQAITVDMSYFYYCKFADNSASFEKLMTRLWALQKVSLRSCKAGA